MRTRTALIAATLAMAVGVVALVLYQERFEAEASGGELIAVVVAAQDLPLGTVLTTDVLGVRDVPEAYREPRHIPAADVERVLGLRISSAVHANESLLWTDIANAEQRRDLSALVQEGRRAFALRTDPASHFGGLLRPGDRVDVLLTTERDQAHETAAIAQNVLVLATGRDTGSRSASSASGGLREADLVTLSVTLEQSQTLALARERGTVSLVLRNPNDIQLVERPPTKTSRALTEATRTGATP